MAITTKSVMFKKTEAALNEVRAIAEATGSTWQAYDQGEDMLVIFTFHGDGIDGVGECEVDTSVGSDYHYLQSILEDPSTVPYLAYKLPPNESIFSEEGK